MSEDKCNCDICKSKRGEAPWQIQQRRWLTVLILQDCILVIAGFILGLIAGQI